MSDKKSKAELLEMLAEAVRNTQPLQPATKPKARNTQPARKRAVAASTSIERWQISASRPFSPSTTFMNCTIYRDIEASPGDFRRTRTAPGHSGPDIRTAPAKDRSKNALCKLNRWIVQ